MMLALAIMMGVAGKPYSCTCTNVPRLLPPNVSCPCTGTFTPGDVPLHCHCLGNFSTSMEIVCVKCGEHKCKNKWSLRGAAQCTPLPPPPPPNPPPPPPPTRYIHASTAAYAAEAAAGGPRSAVELAALRRHIVEQPKVRAKYEISAAAKAAEAAGNAGPWTEEETRESEERILPSPLEIL
jgi:hypothetical protein